jgi:two-component system OmpR family sensor kinase
VSLRARLIAGLLVVAAAGLVLLASVTYAEQRSFQLELKDRQARAARGAVEHELSDQSPGGGRPLREGGPLGGGPAKGGPGDADRGVNLPPGTYGEHRNASGERVGSPVVLSFYGEAALPPPRIPSNLKIGEPITVHASGNSGLRYRVLASPALGGTGMTVVAVPLSEVDRTLDRLLLVEALVVGGVLLAIGLLAWFVVRLGLRPLERMEHTAGAIAAGDLSRRVSPATSRTEVGRLGLALNAMLERLERAFAERKASEDKLRTFLADASHELRTPLASIRGYAELFRTGPARDEANTEKAMRRIEDEAARMGVLVEDLLTLARLEEAREEVRREVDLGAIARDAVDDARATGPERAIAIDADPAAVVVGDPHQLRQVAGNLMRNAIVHTPPGTPIEVSVERESAGATLVVRDHGPGLPQADNDALFERFWRAEGGRERGRGGAGLGLAIVAGIVDAHGGRVEAENAAGGGARFTVRLPVAPAPKSAPRRAIPA